MKRVISLILTIAICVSTISFTSSAAGAAENGSVSPQPLATNDSALAKEPSAIGKNAFYNCESLKKTIIPEKVTGLGAYTFYNCTALESIQLESALSEMSGPPTGQTIGTNVPSAAT